MLPLVSVAAINYNNERFIIETLDSIHDQTYPNIEIVIIDDCSTDNSVNLAKEWLTTCKRPFKFICHEVNKGVCAACNSALKNSTGKYYSNVGTDDALMPDKIEKQVTLLEASSEKVAAVYSDGYLMDVESKPMEGLFIQMHRKFTTIPSGNIYDELLQGNYIPAMSMLIKRAALDDIGIFDERLVYEDYDMWLRLAEKYEIIFSDHISVRYRIRPWSLSFTIKNWKPSDVMLFMKHAKAKALPVDRLKRIVAEAYTSNDTTTMPLIQKLAEATGNRHFKAAWMLWKHKVNYPTAEIILSRVDDYIRTGRNKVYIDLCILKDVKAAVKAGLVTAMPH